MNKPDGGAWVGVYSSEGFPQPTATARCISDRVRVGPRLNLGPAPKPVFVVQYIGLPMCVTETLSQPQLDEKEQQNMQNKNSTSRAVALSQSRNLYSSHCQASSLAHSYFCVLKRVSNTIQSTEKLIFLVCTIFPSFFENRAPCSLLLHALLSQGRV